MRRARALAGLVQHLLEALHLRRRVFQTSKTRHIHTSFSPAHRATFFFRLYFSKLYKYHRKNRSIMLILNGSLVRAQNIRKKYEDGMRFHG